MPPADLSGLGTPGVPLQPPIDIGRQAPSGARPVEGMSLDQIDAELATLRGQTASPGASAPSPSPSAPSPSVVTAPTGGARPVEGMTVEQIDAELAQLKPGTGAPTVPDVPDVPPPDQGLAIGDWLTRAGRGVTDLLDKVPGPEQWFGTSKPAPHGPVYGGTPAGETRPPGYEEREPGVDETVNPVEMALPATNVWMASRLAARYGWSQVANWAAQGGALELGHKINQAVGITPGKVTDLGVQDVWNLILPALTEGAIPAAWRGTVRQLPGASRVGHELAADTLEQLPGRYAPQTASDALFGQAAQHNAPIRIDNVWREASDIFSHEMGLQPAHRNGPLLQAAQDYLRLGQQYGQDIPMQVLNGYRERLRLMMDQASRENWPQRQGLGRLYGAIHDDLADAAVRNVPGADVLRQAIGTSRREHGLDQLAELWQPGRGITTVEGAMPQVQGGRILNQFDNLVATNPRFAGSFAPQELAQIRKTLQDIARMTARPPTAQGAAGQALRWGARTFGLGTAVHGEPLLGVGIEMVGEVLPYAISSLLQTQVGRNVVRNAFARGGGQLTREGMGEILHAVGLGAVTQAVAP